VLPGEDQFVETGPNWLLVMLSRLDVEMKAKVLMLFWRAWHLGNDVIHGDGRGSVVGSALFLVSYIESLRLAETGIQGDFGNKGKGLVQVSAHRLPGHPKKVSHGKKVAGQWKPPPIGWVKLNTDADFCSTSGKASTGVVVWDHVGKVLLLAWSSLHHCRSPEAAEACL
jgi:hypothetical protein